MGSSDETIMAGADGSAPDAGGEAGGAVSDSAQFVGEFKLLRKLGSGAMGEVHLAQHGVTGQEVALKLITNRYAADEGFIKRFKRETDILLRLNHPNIGRAFALGIDHERPFLAMEYIAGPNLGDVLAQRGALFELDVLRLAIQVSRGLAYAQTEAGLVHRDIKPANILLSQPSKGDRSGQLMLDGDQAKIIDFGLAKSVDAEDQRLTLTGIVMGTPAYMSPEQIRCDGDVDFHTDIYAVGASMYHLLTGQVPYPGAAPAIIMTGHLTQPVPDPGALVPSLNPLTRKLIMTAMAKQVKDRFIDYRGLINACEKAIKAIGTPEPGSARFLRKPLVRSNRASEPTQAPLINDEEDFVAHPGDADSRSITRAAGPKPPSTSTHRRQLTAGSVRPPPPATKKDSDSSKHFKPSAADFSGSPALESNRPQSAPAVAVTGSDALRQVFTDKVEKAKTTARIRKNELKMQALDLEARNISTGGPTQVRLGDQVISLAPWLLISSALIALIVLFVMQQH